LQFIALQFVSSEAKKYYPRAFRPLCIEVVLISGGAEYDTN